MRTATLAAPNAGEAAALSEDGSVYTNDLPPPRTREHWLGRVPVRAQPFQPRVLTVSEHENGSSACWIY
eukprot:3515912-Amphidinium_carterae.1